MTYQQALVPLIEQAYGDLWRNARALGDRLDYKASDVTRTPLDMLQECAMVPAALAPILNARAMVGEEEFSEESAAGLKGQLTTVDACEAHFESTKAQVFQAIADFPEDRLEEPIETPWGTFPWRDFMAYLYWNPMYHTGQIAYVGMVHGDAEMH